MTQQNRPTARQRAIINEFREDYHRTGVARDQEDLTEEEQDALDAVSAETWAGCQDLGALVEKHGPEEGERAYIRKLVAEKSEQDKPAHKVQLETSWRRAPWWGVGMALVLPFWLIFQVFKVLRWAVIHSLLGVGCVLVFVFIDLPLRVLHAVCGSSAEFETGLMTEEEAAEATFWNNYLARPAAILVAVMRVGQYVIIVGLMLLGIAWATAWLVT